MPWKVKDTVIQLRLLDAEILPVRATRKSSSPRNEKRKRKGQVTHVLELRRPQLPTGTVVVGGEKGDERS